MIKIEFTSRNKSEKKSDQVPAILYGFTKESEINEMLFVNKLNFDMQIKNLGSKIFSTIFELVGNQKSYKAIVKDIQLHPISESVVHIDFLAIQEKTDFIAQVPVTAINEDKAPFKKEKGFLYYINRKIKVICQMDTIPNYIECDVSEMSNGQVFSTKDIKNKDIRFVKHCNLISILD